MTASLVFLVLTTFTAQLPERGLPENLTGDPHAIYLYGEMMGTLHGARSLYFEATHCFYSVKEGKKRYPSESSYKAWLMKPNFARLEVCRSDQEPYGVLVGDGDDFWLYWPNGTRFFTSAYSGGSGMTETDVYLKKRAPPGMHSLAHEIGYIGTGTMSILELSSFHGYVESMTDFLGAITLEGEEEVRDELCDIVRLSFMKGQRERWLWISRRDHLPRKLKSTVHVAYDIFVEEEWTNVRLNEDLDSALFEWTPPDGWERREMPDPNDALLQLGDKAPGFSLPDAKGRQVTLSDLRGTPVWLMFWRVG